MKKIIAVLVAALLVPFLAAAPAAAITSTDVVFVHGYSCAGPKASVGGPVQYMYLNGAPAASLHMVKYYDCEATAAGDQLVGYGPRYANYAALFGSPAASFDEPIQLIAYELAWYLWDNFTSQGKPVDLVGHSMGGLVIAWALFRTALHDTWFPPSLTVPSVVTFSTPYRGVDLPGCATVECQQLAPGSALLTKLAQYGVGYGLSQWSVVGSCALDLVDSRSSTGVLGATNRLIYVTPCYDHMGYLWDYSNKRDSTGLYNTVPFTLGYRSLAYMAHILR